MLVAVYILRGNDKFATTVDADSVHNAVRAAIRFFSDPFWRGPKPAPDSVYEVSRFYGERRSWRVRAQDLEKSAAGHPS